MQNEIEKIKEKVIRNEEKLKFIPTLKREEDDKIEKMRIDIDILSENYKKLKNKNKLEIELEKLKNHEYNPECKYCCQNEKVIQGYTIRSDIKEIVEHFKELNISVDIGIEDDKKMLEKFKNDLLVSRNLKDELISLRNKNKKMEKEKLEKKNKKLKSKIQKIESVILFQKYKKDFENKKHNEKINSKIKNLNLEKNKIIHSREEFEKQIVRLECGIEKNNENIKKMVKLDSTVDTLSSKVDILKKYLKIVSSNGIPLFMLSDLIPKLEEEVGKFISTFVSFKLMVRINKNNIDILVSEDKKGVRKWNASNCSGFEQFIINLGFKIVINKISNTHSPDFIAIDEGWGCFDNNNIEKVEKIFDIMREHYKFVIIISHIEKLKEKVDMNVEIIYDGGYSRIV